MNDFVYWIGAVLLILTLVVVNFILMRAAIWPTRKSGRPTRKHEESAR
jgi:hypothetical protein